MTYTMKRHTDNHESMPCMGGVKPPVMMLLMLITAGEGGGENSVRFFWPFHVKL